MGMARRLLPLCLLLAAGCSPALDASHARQCAFVIEGLHPEGSKIHVLREGVRREDGFVEIAYRVEEPSGFQPRVLNLACGFDGEEIEQVEWNGRPLSETRMIILKRWWMPLYEREGPASADAGPPPARY